MLAHQSSLSHDQVYRDQIQLIRLSLWKNAETWARNGEKARGEKSLEGQLSHSFPGRVTPLGFGPCVLPPPPDSQDH